MMRRDLWLLPICVLLLPALGALVGYTTRPGVDGWYQLAEKSTATPPDYVFGIVWSTLYIFMGLYVWRIARRPSSEMRTNLLRLFAAQFIANLAWSFLFFQAQAFALSTLWIIGLIIAVGILIKRTAPIDRWAAAALVPLFGWMTFALYLCGFVALNN